MGDTILALAMLSALKRALPDAETDLVLNDRLAPLLEGHPSLRRIITFSAAERSSFLRYALKVRRVMRSGHYDALIDMRSTPNTTLFALFGGRRMMRIGLKKAYTRWLYDYRVPRSHSGESMLDHNFRLILPLLPPGSRDMEHRDFRLAISETEMNRFRAYMESEGIDFRRPVMLAGVTAKLAEKTWRQDSMAEVLRRFMERFPDCQIIFNYAPGREEADARRMWEMLGSDKRIFISLRAGSMRELACMAGLSTFYFGLEGGARHIVQAMGRPSYCIVAPGIRKSVWLPATDSPLTRGVAVTDLATADKLAAMNRAEQYDLITPDVVWDGLLRFCEQLKI